jgi:type VI secretion system protein ImpG
VNAGAQLCIDRFTQPVPTARLDGVDINYTAPQPSVGVARFWPDATAGHVPQGLTLPRGTRLTMGQTQAGQPECIFLTTQPVTVFPVTITRAKPTGIPADIPALYHYVDGGHDVSRVRGALRLRLATTNGTALGRLTGLDDLPVYLCGEGKMASQLFELIHTSVVGIVMGVPGEFGKEDLHGARFPGRPVMGVRHEGLEPHESLLRPVRPKFHGHRLVHEFFTLPQRYGFFTITGLAAGLKHIDGPEVEIVLLLSREVAMLDQQVDVSDFSLYCTPVVNLFDTGTERLPINPQNREHLLAPVIDDISGYELHSVDAAQGQVDEDSPTFDFQPFDAALPDDTQRDPHYFTLRRELAMAADSDRRYDTLHEFVQTRTYVQLSGPDRQPDNCGMTLLALRAWLTNGDLPCVLPRNGVNDLAVKDAKAVASVSFVRGPSAPRPPLALGKGGDAAWELVRQFCLELAVFDDSHHEPNPGEGLRLMLAPYLGAGDPSAGRFLDSLVGASVKAVYDMHRWALDPQHTRGVAVTLTFDESKLDGASPFAFALALERYVARHVSELSFTRTTFRTLQRGVVFTWPTRTGTRAAF